MARLADRNRHLTEDEQGISAKYPEVKGDRAMFMDGVVDDAEFTLAVRPFNADDADRLGIDVPMVGVLNDFIFRESTGWCRTRTSFTSTRP